MPGLGLDFGDASDVRVTARTRVKVRVRIALLHCDCDQSSVRFQILILMP